MGAPGTAGGAPGTGLFPRAQVAATRLAIIGMGKTGARELNYVSDVDVIFVGGTSDDEILSAQKILANSGIWVEPASAAGLAGLIHQTKDGTHNLQGKRIVTVCTGHGLKDPGIIMKSMPQPRVLPNDVRALQNLIESGI